MLGASLGESVGYNAPLNVLAVLTELGADFTLWNGAGSQSGLPGSARNLRTNTEISVSLSG